jgi:hypothetical protein
MEDALVPIVLFLTAGTVFCTYFYLRFRGRQAVQETVRLAMERGNEMTPQLLEMLANGNSTHGDLRRGVVLIALAGAFAVMALVLDTVQLYGVAAFPLLVGIAYLVLWRLVPQPSA